VGGGGLTLQTACQTARKVMPPMTGIRTGDGASRKRRLIYRPATAPPDFLINSELNSIFIILERFFFTNVGMWITKSHFKYGVDFDHASKLCINADEFKKKSIFWIQDRRYVEFTQDMKNIILIQFLLHRWDKYCHIRNRNKAKTMPGHRIQKLF